MNEAVQKAIDVIRPKLSSVPCLALVLGSGLGVLAEEGKHATTISYADIPYFPVSTAPSAILFFFMEVYFDVAGFSRRHHPYPGS